MYGHWLPRELLNVVSHLQICEDILINFLVAHVVRHPPIKLTQRHSTGQSSSVSVNALHVSAPADGQVAQRTLATRNYCLNRFAEEFGYMPLLRSEARYDPLLYKDQVSVLRKKYRHMESPAWWLLMLVLLVVLLLCDCPLHQWRDHILFCHQIIILLQWAIDCPPSLAKLLGCCRSNLELSTGTHLTLSADINQTPWH